MSPNRCGTANRRLVTREIERLTEESQALQATVNTRTAQVEELGSRNRTLQQIVQGLDGQLVTQQKATSEL